MAYSLGELTMSNQNKLPLQLENHTETEGTRDVFQTVFRSFAWGGRSSASSLENSFRLRIHELSLTAATTPVGS